MGLTICLFSACHNDIWDAIDGLDSRVTKLEELCKEMNTNITSLQTIVDVLQSNDYITGIVEIKKDGEVIGYTITFGKHDPITIYHGQDGKDGADGKDGQDGQNGADGKDGQDGDSMFQSVTQDENYVYFTLADGIVIKIAKGSSNDQPNEEFIFTITYDPNGGEGVMEKDTFYYGKGNSIKRCEFERMDYFFTTWNTQADGSGISYKADWTLTIDKNIILYAQWNEIDWQDLGLSVKWAPMNLGALRAEEYGDYFAWGEVKAKSRFYESTYKVSNDYNRNNGLTTLTSEDDAVMVNWNRSGRMPTQSEWDELLANCTCTWITQNGVNGCKVTSKINGNSIFLPATGRYGVDGSNNMNIGSSGYYWSSSLDRTYINSNAWGVKFSSSQIDVVSYGRACGCSIRPVCP